MRTLQRIERMAERASISRDSTSLTGIRRAAARTEWVAAALGYCLRASRYVMLTSPVLPMSDDAALYLDLAPGGRHKLKRTPIGTNSEEKLLL